MTPFFLFNALLTVTTCSSREEFISPLPDVPDILYYPPLSKPGLCLNNSDYEPDDFAVAKKGPHTKVTTRSYGTREIDRLRQTADPINAIVPACR